MEIVNPEDLEKKYLRKKDLARRYGVSEAAIYNWVKMGKLPEPMKFHGMKLWPLELIEHLDLERNIEYLEGLDKKWQTILK